AGDRRGCSGSSSVSLDVPSSARREERAEQGFDEVGPEVEAEEVEDGDAAGEDDGVDALAALGLPVDIGEAQPEGELVEHERGADAEDDGEEINRAAGDEDEAEVAAQEHEHHAGHHVVDVQAAPGGDVVEEWQPLVADAVGDEAHDAEGGQEGEGEEEGGLLAGVHDGAEVSRAHVGEERADDQRATAHEQDGHEQHDDEQEGAATTALGGLHARYRVWMRSPGGATTGPGSAAT